MKLQKISYSKAVEEIKKGAAVKKAVIFETGYVVVGDTHYVQSWWTGDRLGYENAQQTFFSLRREAC